MLDAISKTPAPTRPTPKLLESCKVLLSYVESEWGLDDTPTAELENGSGVELAIANARRAINDAQTPDHHQTP